MAKKRTTKKMSGKKKAAKRIDKKVIKRKAKKLTKKVAKKSNKALNKVTKRGAKPAPPLKKVKKMSNLSVSSIQIGSSVPDFSLAATGIETFNLLSMRGKKIVLFFYPKDDTPGCTLEGHEFTKLHDQFKGKNTEIFGVSRDTMGSHERFKTKECYSVDLISDPDETLCTLFGVIKEKNMYGRKVMGIERSTFIIDENGKLMKEWRGVKVDGHAQEVLNSI